MKEIEKAEQRLTEIKNNRAAEITIRRDMIEQAREKARKAAEKESEALASGNVKMYTEARQEGQAAAYEIELHEKRIANLEAAELITSEEYNSVVDAVMDEAARETAKDKAEALALINQLKLILERNSEMIRRVNTFLHEWQYDIYREADKPFVIGKNGTVIHYGNDKAFSDMLIVFYLGKIFERDIYTDYYNSLVKEVEG